MHSENKNEKGNVECIYQKNYHELKQGNKKAHNFEIVMKNSIYSFDDILCI